MIMKHKKIYLSVSYDTSKTVIQQVKKLIESQGVEVLMYIKGSNYSSIMLLKSDMVLSIPPDDIIQEELRTEKIQYNFSVGRGQYNEAEFACENDIPYYMLTRGLSEFSKFHSIFTDMPDNWKKNYGNIILRNNYKLESILSNTNKNRLLLLN